MSRLSIPDHKTRFSKAAVYSSPDSFPHREIDHDNVFLDDREIQEWFDVATEASKRLAFVLQKLLPKIQEFLHGQTLTQSLGTILNLSLPTIDYVLHNLRLPSLKSVILIFGDPDFVTSSVTITKESFQTQFSTFVMLRKLSIIVRRLKLSAVELKWVLHYRELPNDPSVAWLDLGALPLELSEVSEVGLISWVRLCALAQLRDSLHNREIALDNIFSKAREFSTVAVDGVIAAATGW
ncbi:MAG: hypothetical protein Q9210_002054 [Variospora velana]